MQSPDEEDEKVIERNRVEEDAENVGEETEIERTVKMSEEEHSICLKDTRVDDVIQPEELLDYEDMDDFQGECWCYI